MRFITKLAVVLIGWNFLPPADAPAPSLRYMPTEQNVSESIRRGAAQSIAGPLSSGKVDPNAERRRPLAS